MKSIAKLTVLLASAMLVAACGSGIASTSTAAPAATTAPAAETTAATATGAELALATTDLGDVLVDAGGRTLYVFMPDAQGDSTCYDTCADNWPALTDEVSAGSGVDAGLLGTTTRTDGAVQVTYNGWPLYYFGGDSAAGDTNGQGLQDVWWVVDATGNAVGA